MRESRAYVARRVQSWQAGDERATSDGVGDETLCFGLAVGAGDGGNRDAEVGLRARGASGVARRGRAAPVLMPSAIRSAMRRRYFGVPSSVWSSSGSAMAVSASKFMGVSAVTAALAPPGATVRPS